MRMVDFQLLEQLLPGWMFKMLWGAYARRILIVDKRKEGNGMLTKTLKFDDEVTALLRRSRWSADGRFLQMPKVDPDIYRRVNKALEAMGGKWNRGVQGHIFKDDPRPLVAGLIETGTLVVARDGFFETPAPTVETMLEIVPLTGGLVLEPEAGEGAILDVLRAHRPNLPVHAVEINPERCKVLTAKGYRVDCADFLEWQPRDLKIEQVYMNPPFEQEQDIRHVRRAFNLLRVGGTLISVMSPGWQFHSSKLAVEFRAWRERVGGRFIDLPDRSFAASGTDFATCLFWVKKTAN